MTTDKTKEEIAAILRDNIHFSGQVGDYVIHGAIEKLLEREQVQSIGFAEWMMDRYYRVKPGYYARLPRVFEFVSTASPISDIYVIFLNHQV